MRRTLGLPHLRLCLYILVALGTWEAASAQIPPPLPLFPLLLPIAPSAMDSLLEAIQRDDLTSVRGQVEGIDSSSQRA
jgi:hypothetical protein